MDFGGVQHSIVDREGRRRKTHVFRIVLSHSRKGYSEAVFRQTTEEFIRCLENAFHLCDRRDDDTEHQDNCPSYAWPPKRLALGHAATSDCPW